MERQIATTSEQSARLLRCGVPADTADMHFDMDEERYKGWRFTGTLLKLRKCPAWSFSALLGLLPKKIDDEYKSRLYTFRIKHEHTFPDFPWQIKYESARLSKNPLFVARDPIDACVKAIEWLAENNYKLNKQ